MEKIENLRRKKERMTVYDIEIVYNDSKIRTQGGNVHDR